MESRTIHLILFSTLLARLAAPQVQTPAEAVSSTDVQIAQRAREILASTERWNRADTGCPADARTFSIYCALRKASEETTGEFRGQSPVMIEARQVADFVAVRKYPEERRNVHPRLTDYNNDATTTFADVQAFFRILENRVVKLLASPEATQPQRLSTCRFHPLTDRWEGSCGSMFGQSPIFTIARATSITTGMWRKDAQPTSVWAGSMADPDAPIEIELYAGGAGVMRTEYGWFPVSAFDAGGSTLTFQVDAAHEVAPNALDREIVRRAAAILTNDAVWNRADNRKCAPNATTWSIYCAVERASIDLIGAFHHRRPATELVRQIVDERTRGRQYSHRLMDYNNDPSTHLTDVQSLFAEAEARIK